MPARRIEANTSFLPSSNGRKKRGFRPSLSRNGKGDGHRPPALPPAKEQELICATVTDLTTLFLKHSTHQLARYAADCISGLTERELISLHDRMFGTNAGSVLDPIVRWTFSANA
ncbi:hypothetical protein DEM27_31205 [Metarhizobium album]|uniref:Uncharacterized protein n=1 Tax=Metarhizobium album TaxID=2182425 RepID=A0A2U2DGH2_9HYPH|nr:hypothetical protein DEM27_31205 [Rhizobium album]